MSSGIPPQSALPKDHSQINRKQVEKDRNHFRSISSQELFQVESKETKGEKELFLETNPHFWKGEFDVFKNNPRSNLAQVSNGGTVDELNHEIEKIKTELKQKFKEESEFENAFQHTINIKSGPKERTAIHFSLASFKKYQLLLKSGANVYAVDKDLNNCLHIACALGLSIEVIADLVSEQKLNVNALNKEKLTPLHFVNSIRASLRTRHHHPDSKSNLLAKKNGSGSDSELSGFFRSGVNVNEKILKQKKKLFVLLIENGADVNLVPNLDSELLNILKEIDFRKYTKYLEKQKRSKGRSLSIKLKGVEQREKIRA